MVWHGVVWYGMAWYGMYGMAYCIKVWYIILHDIKLHHVVVWYGTVWYSIVQIYGSHIPILRPSIRRCQKYWFVGSSCLCGLLGPYACRMSFPKVEMAVCIERESFQGDRWKLLRILSRKGPFFSVPRIVRYSQSTCLCCYLVN